jgi:ADP-ribose pyrophosphatase YjhB (NUDIX family)
MSFIENTLYKQILKSMPVLTIDLIVLDSNTKKYILVKRNNPPLQNEAMTPGGRILKNENAVSAAVRICKQELGLNIPQLNWGFMGFFEGMWDENIFEDPAVSTHTLSVVFYSRLLVNSSDVVLDSQSSEFILSDKLPSIISQSSYVIPTPSK